MSKDNGQAVMSGVARELVSIVTKTDRIKTDSWASTYSRGNAGSCYESNQIMVQLTSGCFQQVESRTPLDSRTQLVEAIPRKASVPTRIGLAARSMWPGLAARSVRPVWVSIGTCATIAEYESILDKDAMMKEIWNRGPIACALDVGLHWQMRAVP